MPGSPCPRFLVVSAPASLDEGSYSGKIPLTSADLPGFSLEITVQAYYQMFKAYLPVALR